MDMDKRDGAAGHGAGFHLSVPTYVQPVKVGQCEDSCQNPGGRGGRGTWMGHGWDMGHPAVDKLAAEGRVNMLLISWPSIHIQDHFISVFSHGRRTKCEPPPLCQHR